MQNQFAEANSTIESLRKELEASHQRMKELEKQVSELQCQGSERESAINAHVRAVEKSLSDAQATITEWQEKERHARADRDQQVALTREVSVTRHETATGDGEDPAKMIKSQKIFLRNEKRLLLIEKNTRSKQEKSSMMI